MGIRIGLSKQPNMRFEESFTQLHKKSPLIKICFYSLAKAKVAIFHELQNIFFIYFS